MAHPKSIVFAFVSFRKTTNAFVNAVGMENFPSTSQDFVSVSLMANIPNQLIIRRIEYIMKCYGQFDNTQRSPKMASIH